METIAILATLLPFLWVVSADPPTALLVLLVNLAVLIIAVATLRPIWPNDNRPMAFFCMYLLLISIASALIYAGHSVSDLHKVMTDDAMFYFVQASTIAESGSDIGRDVLNANYTGYQLVLSTLFGAFGTNPLVGIVLNYALVMLSAILIAKSSFLISNSASASFAALAFMCALPQISAIALTLLKDALIYFAFSLFLLGTIEFTQGRKLANPLICAFAAILILGITRIPYLFFLALMFYLICTHSRINRNRRLTLLLILATATTVSIPYLLGFTSIEFSSHFVQKTALENQLLSDAFETGASQSGVVGQLLADYQSWSIVRKLLFIPITTGIQLVTPFNFWQLNFLDGDPIKFIHEQMNLVWVGFLSVIVVCTMLNLRRLHNQMASRLFVGGVVIYIVVAFVNGGVVPRYAIPAFVFVAPAVGIFSVQVKRDAAIKRLLSTCFVIYYILAALMAGCYLLFKVYVGRI